ncbi:unnamed protein product [Chrysoparadoxa australica]
MQASHLLRGYEDDRATKENKFGSINAEINSSEQTTRRSLNDQSTQLRIAEKEDCFQSPALKIWQQPARSRAVLRGLDKIFSMAQSEDTFSLFGSDLIQCFHDIARVAGEPVRARAIMYEEQLSSRWKATGTLTSWKQRATPQELLDFIGSMYCLQRAGIYSEVLNLPRKAEVAAELPNYTIKEYLGWNPLTEPPHAASCDIYTSEKIGVYRVMSNSLIHTYYADRVGLSLGCTYADVFKWLPHLRPYQGPKQLRWQDYLDQCFLVAHIVFSCNNWGEMRLEPELFPHEYYFVEEHLAVQIKQRDVHLAGEFIEVLRCFGGADSDPLMMAGITFLLEAQEEDGSWDRGEDRDDYTTYHATMVGIQALVARSYSGYGPSMTDVAECLGAWYAEESSSALQVYIGGCDTRLSQLDCAVLSMNNRLQRLAEEEQRRRLADKVVADVIEHRGQLEAYASRADWQNVFELLGLLKRRGDITLGVLKRVQIGALVKRLRKAPHDAVAAAATALVTRWRSAVLQEQLKRSKRKRRRWQT